MIVELTYDNGGHISTWEVPTHLRGKVDRFMKELFERFTEKKDIEEWGLWFCGGEWSIPDSKSDKFYSQIVKIYSKMTVEKEGTTK